MRGTLEVHASPAALVQKAAAMIVHLLHEAIALRGRASLALSGGSTPRRLYEELGSQEHSEKVDWNNVHLFWGDERCVSPSSAESNYRMVRESLLARVKIPVSSIHRVLTELPPREAAIQYEQVMREFFRVPAHGLPVFDVMLLGLGSDGHTASLFPSSPVLHEHTRLAAEVFIEQKSQYRITVTLPVINNAATVIFLVSGSGKASIVGKIFEGDSTGYPAQLVRPTSGQLFWLVDKDAAVNLHAGQGQ